MNTDDHGFTGARECQGRAGIAGVRADYQSGRVTGRGVTVRMRASEGRIKYPSYAV